MPTDLNPAARAEWMRLVAETLKTGVLTETDRGILKAAARAYAMWQKAEALLDRHGLTYETENTTGGTVIKKRPEVEIASDSWRRYRAALCELGLTPSARSRVQANDADEAADPATKYLQ